MEPLFKPEDLISSYSRAQAIADGELIDVTEAANQRAFSLPMVLTSSVYAGLVSREATEKEWVPGDQLDHVLSLLYTAVRSAHDKSDRLYVGIPTHRGMVETVVLHVGPGDTAEPVITVGYPEDF